MSRRPSFLVGMAAGIMLANVIYITVWLVH